MEENITHTHRTHTHLHKTAVQWQAHKHRHTHWPPSDSLTVQELAALSPLLADSILLVYSCVCVCIHLHTAVIVRVTKAPSHWRDTSHSLAICELISARCLIACDGVCNVSCWITCRCSCYTVAPCFCYSEEAFRKTYFVAFCLAVYYVLIQFMCRVWDFSLKDV